MQTRSFFLVFLYTLFVVLLIILEVYHSAAFQEIILLLYRSKIHLHLVYYIYALIFWSPVFQFILHFFHFTYITAFTLSAPLSCLCELSDVVDVA